MVLCHQVPRGVEELRLFSPSPDRRGQSLGVGSRREVVPMLTVHSAKAYATLITHCPRLHTLHIHNHRQA
jgi:hypothetical protein